MEIDRNQEHATHADEKGHVRNPHEHRRAGTATEHEIFIHSDVSARCADAGIGGHQHSSNSCRCADQ